MENNNDQMIIGILTGFAVGAGLGILFAPSKGSKTRGKIKDSVVDTTEDISAWLQLVKDELAQSAHDNKQTFDKNIEHSMSTMNHKADDILSGLENQLEELKKKNA